jgi:hypothetical protein
MQLTVVTPKSKPATVRLTGRCVELANDPCRCGSRDAIIDGNRQLNCRSCGRPRGFLSAFTANWIIEVIKTIGAEGITIHGPKL